MPSGGSGTETSGSSQAIGGGRLKTDESLIVSYEHGYREVLFTPPPPSQTESLLRGLIDGYTEAAAAEAALGAHQHRAGM